MGEAFFWGLLTSSSLVIGALIALRYDIGLGALGTIMGFGVGVLISSIAYELVGEAFGLSEGHWVIAVGLAAGALTFFFGDTVISREGSRRRKSPEGMEDSSAMSIVLGTVLDGIPESVVVGLTLLSGRPGIALIVSVFLSNLPESISASAGLRKSGYSARSIFGLWTGVTVVAGIAAAVGFGLLGNSSPDVVALVMSFAAGALLTMVADTMAPEAYEYRGRFVGLVTTLGFAIAFALSVLE